jgi:8-amino-7-oxononanoate synthase
MNIDQSLRYADGVGALLAAPARPQARPGRRRELERPTQADAPLARLVRRRDQRVPALVAALAGADALVAQPLDAAAGPRVRVGGRSVLSFAATDYLGLARDPRVAAATARAVGRWGVSLATPRLLAVDRLTRRLETALARLVGQPAACVFPSTTHAALDVLPLLAGPRGVLLVDEWAYPISLEGARLAAQQGARLERFPHDDLAALARRLARHAGNPDKVIVCDGVYPVGGRPAPLRAMDALARDFDAVVYVDDAHGVGLLGARTTTIPRLGRTGARPFTGSPVGQMSNGPGAVPPFGRLDARSLAGHRHRQGGAGGAGACPYGWGGGGTPRYLGVAPGRVVHVGSLSKALGVPLAFVAGPRAFVDYLRATAPTYTHSSPPALPVLAAALAALAVHAAEGDARRQTLAARVRYFRRALATAGLPPLTDTLFPIQTIGFATPLAARVVAASLRRQGVWPVLQLWPPERPQGGVLRFVLTAQHAESDLDQAVAALARSLSAGNT